MFKRDTRAGHSHDVLPCWSEKDVTEECREVGQWLLIATLDLQPTDAAQVRHQVMKCAAMMKRQRINK